MQNNLAVWKKVKFGMDDHYRVSKNVLYPKMQNFKNFYYNKDNQICYIDLLKR